jgi:uncharacterized protein
MNDLNSKEVSDICVKCGMCCDGTLFNRGKIVDDLDKENIKKLGIEIIAIKDEEAFKQPCNKFIGCCSIYDKIRPKVCNSFYCEPLKKYEKNLQTLKEAENQINTVLKLKSEMNEIFDRFDFFNKKNWQERLVKLDDIIDNGKSEDLKKYGILILKLNFFKHSKKSLYTRERKIT